MLTVPVLGALYHFVDCLCTENVSSQTRHFTGKERHVSLFDEIRGNCFVMLCEYQHQYFVHVVQP